MELNKSVQDVPCGKILDEAIRKLEKVTFLCHNKATMEQLVKTYLNFTEFRNRASDYLAQIQTGGTVFIITHFGKPVAEVRPASSSFSSEAIPSDPLQYAGIFKALSPPAWKQFKKSLRRSSFFQKKRNVLF